MGVLDFAIYNELLKAGHQRSFKPPMPSHDIYFPEVANINDYLNRNPPEYEVRKIDQSEDFEIVPKAGLENNSELLFRAVDNFIIKNDEREFFFKINTSVDSFPIIIKSGTKAHTLIKEKGFPFTMVLMLIEDAPWYKIFFKLR